MRCAKQVLGVGWRSSLAWVLGLTVGATPGSGQVSRIGLIGGITAGSVSGGQVLEGSSGTGFVVGASAGFRIAPRLELSPEVRVIRKVFSDLDPLALVPDCPLDALCGGAAFPGRKVRTTFVEVPALVRYRLPVTGAGAKTGFFLTGGPMMAFRVGCSIDTDLGSAGPSCDATEQFMLLCAEVPCTSLHRMDYGFVLGIGFDLGALRFSAQWDRGLRSLTATDTPPLTGLRGAKQSTLVFGVDLGVPIR